MEVNSTANYRDAIIGQADIVNYPETHEATGLVDFLDELSLDKSSGERQPGVPFDAQRCLFCTARTHDLDANLEHMLRQHEFAIPDVPSLIVDVETLVKYCHLIIYGYFECLSCGSQRHSAEAARQHMVGRRHCHIDVHSEGSEFKDFYNFDYDSSETTSGGSEGENTDKGQSRDGCVEVDDALRLPSGKLLSRRPQGSLHPQRKSSGNRKEKKLLPPPSSIGNQNADIGIPVSEAEESIMMSAGNPSSKRIVKHEASFRSQLASLRDEDRRSLMHLPLSRQRALVMKSKKQVEQARRQENETLLKIQLKANGNR